LKYFTAQVIAKASLSELVNFNSDSLSADYHKQLGATDCRPQTEQVQRQVLDQRRLL